jgi:hypothetical protein
VNVKWGHSLEGVGNKFKSGEKYHISEAITYRRIRVIHKNYTLYLIGVKAPFTKLVSRLKNSLNKSELWAGSSDRLPTKNVTPAKAGVQNPLKILDSCFRRNDKSIVL